MQRGGATIGLQYDMLSCQYLSNTPELVDSTYTHYVIEMPKYESIRLTPEQQQKIQEFVQPIFLNSFMYINRLTDPNTYSDNAYVVQLRINGCCISKPSVCRTFLILQNSSDI